METILGLTLFAALIVGSAPFFVSALQAVQGLGIKQTAVTLANQRVEYVRSLKTSQLVTGRNQADVAALIAAPGLVNLSSDVTASGNYDPLAAAGSANAAMPLTQTQTVNGMTYTIRTYINVCYLSRTTNLCTAVAGTGSATYRISVDVSWLRLPGVRCTSGRTGQCEYVVTTLADASTDPVFSIYGKPTITQVLDTTAPPISLAVAHPGQVLPLQVLGTNFDVNSTVLGNNGDAVGNVSIASSTSASLSYQVSSTLGTHTLTIQNPNGSTGTYPIPVAISTPAITALSPASTSGFLFASRTFTITGSDFFATPSQATQTVKPTITFSATRAAVPFPLTWQPTISAITVVNRTTVTFSAFNFLTLGAGTYTGTLTLTNPDGGTVSYPFTETLT